MTQTIPVFFSINDAYAPFLSVALTSIVAHADPQKKYELIVLYEDLNAENRERLGQLATTNVSIQFVTVNENLLKQLAGEHMKLRGDMFTLTIYYRLFIAAMFPQYDKAIYLDADVVATTDLAELFQTDLGTNLVGAVQDTFAADNPQSVRYVEHHLQLPIADYFNSGMMVLNLKQMRAENFSETFTRLLTTYHVEFIAPDQDYLNELCRNRVVHIDRAWNVMPTQQSRVVAPKLLHFSLFGKPWHYADAQNGQYFWDYAAQSPYFAEIKAIQRTFTASDQAKDTAAEKGLLATLKTFSEKDRHDIQQFRREIARN
ncbi:glycosyltransferase family 8 protein [Levilactobacillus brevis]|uniref:Glycosyltransferase family 8 protein n=1 Tax=Levilactobacillus hammesii TaxID=267633 RepID=A0A921JWD5_9LACO|nr:glycosyltransferase family 8 protein [Levilactobacillus brevis]HJE86724.1 glycosyltransferase family 8 protein [Levilactobacillus hammesii]